MKYIKPFQIKNLNESTEPILNDDFWKWFGESKAINNGTPIVCYHGTDSDFNMFSKTKMGTNHWQSKSNSYGGGFFFADKERYGYKHVKKVFLKIENPYLVKLEDKYGYEVDYYHAVDKFDMNPSLYFQLAKENGNDGIIITTPRGSLYIVFEPNQIKSIDNDGTWDINDDNIYS